MVVLALMLLMLVTGCRSEDPAPPLPTFSASLNRVLSIGEGTDLEREYIFGHATAVQTDSKGVIYVADIPSFEIRAYDRQGNFLRKMGSLGRAPGEFKHFTGLYINHDDEIIIGDHQNRRITKFSTEGELLDTYTLDFDLLMYPRWIGELNRGEYVVATIPPGTRPDHDYIFHTFTSDFQEKLSAFGPADYYGDRSDYAIDFLSGTEVGSVLASPNKILYAPRFYQGKIYVFERHQDTWKMARTLQGYVNQTKAITTINDLDIRRGDYSAGLSRSSGKRLTVVFENESVGLWRLNDGKLAHFTVIRSGKDRVFGVELFDAEGNRLGYAELETIAGTGPYNVGYVTKRLHWKDQEDVFYFVELDLDKGSFHVAGYALEYELASYAHPQ